jgi:hypothetical protein
MHRISDPAVRAVAERFERETGRKISEEVPAEETEAVIEQFLTAQGYPCFVTNPAAGSMGHDVHGEPAAKSKKPGRQDEYQGLVEEARAALQMIREALEQYGSLAGLPGGDHVRAPRLTEEAEELTRAIIRLGNAAMAAGAASALTTGSKPKP